MKRRYVSAIILLVLLLGAGSYALLGSTWNPARAAPPPRPLSNAPWSTNVKVNDDTGTATQGSPSIAVDATGNAYAVWWDDRNDDGDIYFSYRPAGGHWGANIKVNDDAGTAGQYWPSIAVDASGNAYAVWKDTRNDSHDIYFSYRPADGSWGANIRVNDDTGWELRDLPCIAVDLSGNAYAVWQEGYWDSDICFSYRPADGSWGENIRVNDDTGAAHQYSPSIAVDASGNAYSVWGDQRNGQDNADIYFSYRPVGGSWGENIKVNDDPGEAGQYSPSIAVDPSGNAYGVWDDHRNDQHDIYSSYRPADGSWGENIRVDDGAGADKQYGPSIAVDASGNAYAVWSDYRNGNLDIYFSYRATGGTWEPDIRVNDDAGTAMQDSPSIAVDTSGNAYAVWGDSRNLSSVWDIYFSYRPVLEERIYLPLIMKKY